ncbi:MAG: hypothetical protein KKE62_10115 [Proteobacteria bacterium]|nr:hypothetical protein [Pseudomonadota bacterium]MBU1387517.1 hypothetical protein [Pseudomonadota bacterium]MBU1543182.1 hypothetical protein [Pseudomonadota bacterium]MBU2480936.1 hypothetical protein [Pseudomonadota bacterium]
MDSNNLNNFRPDIKDFDKEDPAAGSDTPIQSSEYLEEINTLKIDKLSNRVTIISIIIPCLIGAILLFAYLDMKERVVDADLNKQTQYEKISRQLEEKLNALDVKIAKNRYDLDSSVPALEKKNLALEGQLTKKADAGTIQKQIEKLETRVTENTNQSVVMNEKTLAALKETRDRFDKTAKQIKEDITLFKDEFDARLLELSEYEQQIGTLRKDFSLLDKKQNRFAQEYILKTESGQQAAELKTQLENQIKQLNTRIKELDEKMSATISKFQNDINSIPKSGASKASDTNVKPSARINIDSSKSVGIKEEPLKQ